MLPARDELGTTASMTSAQLLVLALLAAAFAAGWYARGGGRRDGGHFEAALDAGSQALDDAHAACAAALRGDDSGLDAAGAALRAARRELSEQVGTESPLVEDVESARDAVTLVTTTVRDGPVESAAPLVAVVRDARVRYRRAAAAIEQLPE